MNIEKFRKAVGLWLLGMSALVFTMILVGGLTRLTESGLSMVRWELLMGTIPPITSADWGSLFEEYKAYPEYQKVNVGMTLGEFKKIFWFEYGHRMLGRFIGLAFALPFAFFLWKKAFPTKMVPKLVLLFFLGGAQGLIGWWMVKSGLVDRPDVSHYRLTVHLGMAMLLYLSLLWVGLGHLQPSSEAPSFELRQRYRGASVLLCMVYCTILSGGIVAGLNAGLGFNTFPLMNGQVIPTGLFERSPWYTNLTENLMTVQFVHRYLALGTAALVLVFWAWAKRLELSSRQRLSLNVMLGAVLLQVSLGVATLLSVVWLPLASSHQMGAVLLLSALVWVNHELRRPAERAAPSRTEVKLRKQQKN